MYNIIKFEYEVLIKDTWEKGICKVVSNEMSEGCIEQLETAYNWVREDGKVFECSVNPYEVENRWIRKFRVKYLDKEDIESLKFEFINELKGLTEYYEREYINRIDEKQGYMYWKIFLKHHPDTHRIVITANVSDGTLQEKFFEGYCYNISECKILLKQLNIL